MRLDQHLAKNWPEYSRSQWQKFIAAGRVRVNGKVKETIKLSVEKSDKIIVDLPKKPDFRSQSMPVIYEDNHVIVINKPAGILTHSKGNMNDEFSVAEFMRHRMLEPVETNRPGIVHRLDRDTSGVIICARDSETNRYLQKQFQDRKAHKTYLAIVSGIPKHHKARLDLPIERNPKKPATFRVGASGKSATTTYRVLAHNNHMSLLELKPETGRTHQLRVHLAYLGHPILGDRFYGSQKSPINRLCLHALELEITIPTSKRKTFYAPPPQDFKQLILSIGGNL